MKFATPLRWTISHSRRSSTWERQHAFVLAEVMVAMLAGILFLLSMSVVFLTSSVSFANMGNYINMDHSSRNALDQMSRQIRQAKLLTWYSSTLLVFNYDAAISPVTNLTYRYDPAAQALTEEWISAPYSGTNTLLTGCTNLVFTLLDRNLAPTTSIAGNAGKIISVAWRCVGTNITQTASEDIQQAKIVIRNQP